MPDSLIKLSNRRNIHLQVMPFEQPPGRRSPLASRFTLIRVPSPGVAGPLEVAYVEGEAEVRYVDDRKALKAYEAAWARLTNAALKFEETRKFLREVSRDLKVAEFAEPRSERLYRFSRSYGGR